MKKNRKKFLSAILATGVMANLAFPCCASTEIFSGGADGYGAQINDLGGASINKNTGTEAQLGITGNGNTIKWDHLNVGAGNKLDFNFTQSGQVAVNKVTNGISKFAGTVSTSGENGHLIISNPNGMVFVDGSVVNVDAGSATFTTHDVYWDGQKNGNIRTSAKGTNSGIVVGTGTGSVPVFKVSKDCNIIAPGVDVTGADLFAGGTVRMVSADGVNFVAGTHTPEVVSETTINPNAVQYAKVIDAGKVLYMFKNDSNAISIKNTNVNATKSALVDGHLYLYASNGDIALNTVKVGDINAATSTNVTLAGTTITKGGADSKIAAGGNMDIQTSSITNTSLNANNISTSNQTYLHNVKANANNSINIAGGEIDQNSVLSAKDINTNSGTFRNTELKATNDITTSKWTYFHDVNAQAANNITINPGAGLYNSILNAGGDIKIDQAYLNGLVANANNGTISLLGVNATGGATETFNARNMTIQGGAFDTITANATNDINIVGAGIYNGSKISAENNIYVTYGANIQDSSITAQNNISVDGSSSALYLKNVAAKAVNGDINIKNSGKGNGLGIESTSLGAGKNINVANSQLRDIKPMTAGDSITIENSTAYGNLTATAAKNINVNGLTSDANVKLMASDTIDIKNINAKGTISALNANTIVADTIKGNLVYLGGRTKDKAQPGITIGNSAWYEEWNPMASSIIANNIEADLDLRLLSTDKVVANNLKSGGDIHLVGNNVTASNISVTDQKIKTHYPSTNTTTGLIAETYDSWASGWGLANNEGKDSTLKLNNVNIANKAAVVQINAFETVKGENITTPIFIAESVGNMDINNLKTDDIHISNLYYTLFGNGYFDLNNIDIKGITALTDGRDVTLNKSFNPDEFDSSLDKVYGYEHNLLVLQYLNGDYDKIGSKAKNTNLALVNYIDSLKLDNGTVTKITPEIPNNNNNPDNNGNNNGGGNININTNSNDFGNIQAGEDILYKLAKDLDTIFRKKFEPKSFAATDDEIEQMKKQTLQTINGENGLVKITSPFMAY